MWRPPLSKKYLSGELTAERLLFRHRAFYDEHRIELKLGARAMTLDPRARRVELDDGEALTYDRLLLCLGATARRLTCPGADLAGQHYLRTVADVTPIRAAVKPGSRVVIIGGGYIGLETAATCRHMGCEVTVLELADRVMNRVVAPSVSEFFAQEHRAQGIHILCNMRVTRIEGAGRVERVVCADGSETAADALIVGGACEVIGAGVTPRNVVVTGLARPKSISFAPDLVSMMFPGFKSRWMMPSR